MSGRRASPEARSALALVQVLQGELRDTRRLVVKVSVAAIGLAGTALGVAATIAAICL